MVVSSSLVPIVSIAVLVALRNRTIWAVGGDMSVGLLCTVVNVFTMLSVVFVGRFERILMVVNIRGVIRFRTVVTVLFVDRLVVKIWLVGMANLVVIRLVSVTSTVVLFVLVCRLLGWN